MANCLRDLIECLTGFTFPNGDDDSIWENYEYHYYRKLHGHCYGEFSFAQTSGEALMEDYIEVQSRENTVFVVVCDGHRGPEAAKFICKNLINHLSDGAERKRMCETVISYAFAKTELGFLEYVKKNFEKEPEIAASGSGCLLGVIWKKKLYVANLGDSRAVLGRLDSSNKIFAMELEDHNVNIPEDSRSIGDAYLKGPIFALDPKFSKFLPPGPTRQVLRYEPPGIRIKIHPNDQFIIFASDGLWEHLTYEEAVEIVHTNERFDIARRLLVASLKKAAFKSQKSNDEVKSMNVRKRRAVHDDISVVVVFIDHSLLNGGKTVRGNAEPSSSSISSTIGISSAAAESISTAIPSTVGFGSFSSNSGLSSTIGSTYSTAGLSSTVGSLPSNVDDHPKESQTTDAIIDT